MILVAKWTLWMGAGISLLTLATGIYAYNTVLHDTPSHEAMTRHKNFALITLAILLPVVLWSVISEIKGKTLGIGFVGLFLLMGGMLSSTAWLGGEVVYRYGIGVLSVPKTDSHDHAGHHSNTEEMPPSHSSHAHDPAHHSDMTAKPIPMDQDMNMGNMRMDSSESMPQKAE